MKKVILNHSGFSLVEVLIAMGVAGMVSLGVMKINQNMIKGQRTMSQRSNLLDLKNRMIRIFSDQGSCSATIAGLNPIAGGTFNTVSRVGLDSAGLPTPPVPMFSSVVGNPLSRVGVGDTGFLTISAMRVQGFDVASATTFTAFIDPANPGLGTEVRRNGNARIIIELDKPEGTNNQLSYGNGVLTVAFDTTVIINPANTIVSCYADTNQYVQSMCTSMGGSYDQLDGRCKDIVIDTMDQTDGEYSIQSLGSMQVQNGVYIGDGFDAGGVTAIGGPGAAGVHGLGVDMTIPLRGEIAAQKSITSNSGDLIATGGVDPATTLPAGGNVVAQNNITANQGNILASVGSITASQGDIEATLGSLRAGNSAIIQGSGGAGTDSILAVQGNIRAATGDLIGNRLQITGPSCATGGTITIDAATGYATCKQGSPGSCPNFYNPFTGITYIKAFAGYDSAGNIVCKDVMSIDGSSCPAGKVPVGTEIVAGVMKTKCDTLGKGCDTKTVSYWEYVLANPTDPNSIGSWVQKTYSATPGNVCENGYQAPLDDNGFACPGIKENVEIVDPQPLAYGCETSSEAEVYKVVKRFSRWTCGEPTVATDTSNDIVKLPCRLGGLFSNRTYKECFDAGGQVRYYSAAQSYTEEIDAPVAKGTNGVILTVPSLYRPEVYTTGAEERSFCWMPQTNVANTTGRSMSGAIDGCDSSCDSLRTKTFTPAAIRLARQCPAPFVKSKDPFGTYYYEVKPSTCAPRDLKENGANGCALGNIGQSAVIYGGVYASFFEDGDLWYGASIGTPSGVVYGEPADKYMVHPSAVVASTIPTTSAMAYDTVVWDHGWAAPAPAFCQDTDNGEFHYATFACYAEITGIACK